MQEESADELRGTKRHFFALITIASISILKRDVIVPGVDDAMVCDSNSVRISAEIVKYFAWAVKWCFRVYNPILFPELFNENGKSLFKLYDVFGEYQFVTRSRKFQGFYKLAPEHLRQCFDGKQKILP